MLQEDNRSPIESTPSPASSGYRHRFVGHFKSVGTQSSSIEEDEDSKNKQEGCGSF